MGPRAFRGFDLRDDLEEDGGANVVGVYQGNDEPVGRSAGDTIYGGDDGDLIRGGSRGGADVSCHLETGIDRSKLIDVDERRELAQD